MIIGAVTSRSMLLGGLARQTNQADRIGFI
jgi:hypothetical protein